MKVAYKLDTEKRKNSELCFVTQYHLDQETIMDLALIELNGRYPEQGRVTNQKCRELVYIQEGRGKVVIEGKETTLHAGDAVLIEPKEKYYWDGNLKLLITCTPAWSIEQHHQVE